jgi:hypothetical protein
MTKFIIPKDRGQSELLDCGILYLEIELMFCYNLTTPRSKKMKYEDWIKYENKRKNKGAGSLALLKVKKPDSGKKKAPNREIVTSLKRRSLADIFRKFLGI